MRPIRPEDVIYDQPPPVKPRDKRAGQPSVYDAPATPWRITPGEPPVKYPRKETPTALHEPTVPDQAPAIDPLDVPEPKFLRPAIEASAPADLQHEAELPSAMIEEVPSREELEDQFGRHVEALKRSAEQRFVLYQEALSAKQKALETAAAQAGADIPKNTFDALIREGSAALQKFGERLGLLKKQATPERPDAQVEAQRESERAFKAYRDEIVRRLQDATPLIQSDLAFHYGSQIRFADALVSDESVRRDFEQQLLLKPNAARDAETGRQINLLWQVPHFSDTFSASGDM